MKTEKSQGVRRSRPQKVSAPPKVVEPPKAPGKDESLLSKLRVVADTLEEKLRDARNSGVSSRDIATMSTALARTYDRIGRITGEAELTEATILKSPAFQRAESVIVEALRPYPEAAAAVAKALGELAGVVPCETNDRA
jgi:hypothetical protein